MTHPASLQRQAVVRRGRWLARTTLIYNSLEGLVAIGAGLFAGSIALIGFGLDSFIEVTASGAAMWRLHRDANVTHRASAEHVALRVVGISFIALAGYILVDATYSLLRRSAPGESRLGIAVAIASVVVMPLLARAKRRVAVELGSNALGAEARQTDICAYLSGLLLIGLILNALLGWWWADPLCALLMVPLITYEGWQALRGRAICDDCASLGDDLA